MKGLGIALVGILAIAGGIAAATIITKKKLEKQNDEDYYDDWDEEEDCQVTVRLDGPKKDAVRAFLIDRDHGNPYAEWVRQGRPDFPAGEAFEAIKRQEGLQEVRVERPDEDTVRVTLKPHSVLLLEWN